jgi:hypothetical protein
MSSALIDPIMADQGEMEFLGTKPISDPFAKHESAIRKIDELDLSMVKMKLCLPIEKEGKGWTSERVDIVELWYRRFLKLCAVRSKDLVPTKLVDEMWHAHILDTRKYHADCQAIFGHYLHHFPYFGIRGEEDRRNEERSFQSTLALFEEFFGESPVCGVKDGSACQGGDGNGNCSFRHDS